MFVPNEYLTNVHIREKLAEIKVNTNGKQKLFLHVNSLDLVSRLCFFNTKSFLKIYNYFFQAE